ncbi:hypothetical protein IGI37_003801 [Enterococcus sp. AZ194]|uniref:ABC transporter permease n=1 Tax=Enterococcus sp. AZ194 TaxID=2774629 RepID=UPI003F20C1A6
MTESLKRMNTLALFKSKLMLRNSYVLTYMLIPLFMVLFMPLIFKMQVESDTLPQEMLLLIGQMGCMINIGSVAITIPAMLMAEEKEKHTLRTLMVSSIRPLEYLISSLLPAIVSTLAIQMIFIPILVKQIDMVNLFLYILFSLVAIIISSLLGMCFGLFVKDQMTASLIPMPLTFIMMMIPMLAGKIEIMGKINNYFYLSKVNQILDNLILNQPSRLSITDLLAFAVALVISFFFFLWLYKRNGFEKD